MTDSISCPSGHPNPAGSHFCGICGAPVGGGPATPTPPPPPDPLSGFAPPPSTQQPTYVQQSGYPASRAGYPAPGPAQGTPSPAVLVALAGGVAGLVAVFLPWIGSGSMAPKAFDIPLAYLWSTNAAPSDLSIGLVAVIAAGTVLGVLLLKLLGAMPASAARLATSLGGGALSVVVIAFLLQTIRQMMDFGVSFGDIIADFVGLGAWLALAGVVLIGVGSRIGGGIR